MSATPLTRTALVAGRLASRPRLAPTAARLVSRSESTAAASAVAPPPDPASAPSSSGPTSIPPPGRLKTSKPSPPAPDSSLEGLTDAERSMRLKIRLVEESLLMHVPIAGQRPAATKTGKRGDWEKKGGDGVEGGAGDRKGRGGAKGGERKAGVGAKYTFADVGGLAGESVIPSSPRAPRSPPRQPREARADGQSGRPPRSDRSGERQLQRGPGAGPRREQGELHAGPRSGDRPTPRRNDGAAPRSTDGSRPRQTRDRADRPPRTNTAAASAAHLSAAEADWKKAQASQAEARRGLEEMFGAGAGAEIKASGFDVVGEAAQDEVKASKSGSKASLPNKPATSSDYTAFLPPSPLRIALSKGAPGATALSMLDWTLARNGSVSRHQREVARGMAQQRLNV